LYANYGRSAKPLDVAVGSGHRLGTASSHSLFSQGTLVGMLSVIFAARRDAPVVRCGTCLIFIGLAAIAALAAAALAKEDQPPSRVVVDDFQSPPTPEGLPPGWQPLTFEKIKRHTAYRVVREDGNAYLHAESDDAASGLVKAVALDAKVYPMLTWRWRVAHSLPKGDEKTKEGDDFAARVYVNFKYDPDKVGWWTRREYALARAIHGEYPPVHSLCYIWANKVPLGTFVPNAYTDRVMMVAVESGDAKAGKWLTETRNVYEDYKKAFGSEPPEVDSVAVMTDTDNTHSSAVADYDDLSFEPASEHKQQGTPAPSPEK